MQQLLLHNPTLANNSQFRNMVIESLDTDPTLKVGDTGRLWFNSTEKQFKGGFLNSTSDAVDVKAIAKDEDVILLNSNLSEEITNRINAIDGVTTSLNNEITRAIDIETALQTELDTTQTSAGLESNGSFIIDGTNYINAATSLKNASVLIDSALKTEESNRIDADNVLTTALNNETTARTDADNVLTTALNNETTARTDADTALDNRLTTVENQVNGKIGNLEDLTTTDKTNIVASINELDGEIGDLTTLDESLTDKSTIVASINSEVIRANAADDVLTQNINDLTANLNTNFLNKTTTDAQNIAASVAFGAEVTIAGDLVVSGTTTTINTQELTISDNIITLNAGTTGIASENAGLEVDRGDDGITKIVNWNETTDVLEVQQAGSLVAVATATDITNEADARTAADTVLDNRITTVAGEINDTIGALTDLHTDDQTNIVTGINEVHDEMDLNKADLASQDIDKGSNFVGYEGYTENNNTIFDPAVEIEATTVKGAIDALASDVNERFNYIETKAVKGEINDASKSDIYTISHGLNNVFINVSVQVYDESDDIWRFDLVVIEVIDENTIKIYLSSGQPARIRYLINDV